jgi:ribosome-binding protein aMBF1 (putative translation factor)
MFFYLFNRNKSIKELRKSASLTVKELALKIKCDSGKINPIDQKKLKEIPKEMREKLIPIFRGDKYDKIPW